MGGPLKEDRGGRLRKRDIRTMKGAQPLWASVDPHRVPGIRHRGYAEVGFVRRVKRVVALMVVSGLALGLGGCVEPDPEEARTPSDAPTVVNSAPQTDSEGKTVPTPGGETTAAETTDGEAPAGGGDVAAGQAFFETTCQGCHANLGQEALVGPKLAGGGRPEDLIRTTVENGRGAMPPGLAQGEDLDNVVAFVLSIQ
jgi:mono/diheme cytochrome c family protein